MLGSKVESVTDSRKSGRERPDFKTLATRHEGERPCAGVLRSEERVDRRRSLRFQS